MITEKIKRAKTPQKCEFLRYDFRFNLIMNCWQSLQELRDNNVMLEDPMFQNADFANSAGAGDIDTVIQLLKRGVTYFHSLPS